MFRVPSDVCFFGRLMPRVDFGICLVDHRLIGNLIAFTLEAELLKLLVSDALPVLCSNKCGIFAKPVELAADEHQEVHLVRDEFPLALRDCVVN